MISLSHLIMGGVGSKSRSLGQILKKSCLHSRGHIFGPIFPKLAQNVCRDEMLVEYDYGRGWIKRSQGQILEQFCLHSRGAHFWPNIPQTCSECLS